MPDFACETRHRDKGLVAGVDEAGRGPLAGPVVAAAVIFAPDRIPAGLDDSKKLSAKARERLFDAIMAQALGVGVGEAGVAEIDAINIRRATHLAMRRAVEALTPAPAFALVDGNDAPALSCLCETLVGGDGICVSIAAASIIAKVTRDRLMDELHRAYPAYGWADNRGYGTPAHLAALKRLGASEHHRRSFAPVHNMLCGDKPGDSSLTL